MCVYTQVNSVCAWENTVATVHAQQQTHIMTHSDQTNYSKWDSYHCQKELEREMSAVAAQHLWDWEWEVGQET